MADEWNAEEELKPLNIKCTSTDCENDLHCFKQDQRKKNVNQPFGSCRKCGIELVDWERVHKRDFSDVQYTFTALKHETIRHYYWHLEIDQKAINHARRKGKIQLREAVYQRISKSVGSAQNYNEGRQTPKENSGNSIYYAQHATACCCRKCIEYWHEIPQGRDLTVTEIEYFTNLIMLYINERLPFLKENGEKVPRIQNKNPKSSSKTKEKQKL